MTATRLFDRALLRLSPRKDAPADADTNVVEFLQGLVTSDVAKSLPVWAGLLTPQGKALFDFIVWPAEDGLLLDCEAAVADALAKRLSMYRLRKAIDITRETELAVHWAPVQDADSDSASSDPRLAALGQRWLAPVDNGGKPADSEYRAHRLSLGVTEGRAELGDGETLWLECNASELHGVSFTKGCYVGQENTARMNWRSKVNRRLIVVPIAASNEKRCRVQYPDLGLAVDHLKVDDLTPETTPTWLTLESED